MRHQTVESLAKDNLNKKLFGVCAGIARHVGVDRWFIRMLAVLGFFMMPGPMLVAYFVAVLIMPTRY